MDTITTTSSSYYTPPYGSYLYTGSTGFCGDAGLVATVSLPNAVGYMITFYAKEDGGLWHGLGGVAIEKDGYGYGTKACDKLSDGNYNDVYWLACSAGSNQSGGTACILTDPETGSSYKPAFISTSWQRFDVNISRYKNSTFRIRILAMDYNCDWCDMSDHPIELWVDDIIIRKYTFPEPTTSVGGEEVLSPYVNISAATYNNLEILPQIDGFTFILGTGTGQTIATNGYLTIGNGTNTVTTTADTYDPILDINGDFTISSNATFIASNISPAYFAKNWTNNGTFVHSNGTIVFDGSETSTLSGATTFYNFTCTTPNKVLQFPAGTSSTTTIEGTLTLNGGDCSTQIKLRSSIDGSQWYINALATSSINYVDVKDSYAITPLTAYQSSDSGNNTNWTIYPCVAVGAIRIKGCTKLEGGVRLK
jgi:hypothetical protein